MSKAKMGIGSLRKCRKLYKNEDGTSSLDELRQARIAKADFFITTNKEILKDRKELEPVFGIRIFTPKEMNDEMDAGIARMKQKVYK